MSNKKSNDPDGLKWSAVTAANFYNDSVFNSYIRLSSYSFKLYNCFLVNAWIYFRITWTVF